MNVTVGTFNVNNLFGRWNLYVDVSEPPAVAHAAETGSAPPAPPRPWLEPASDAAPVVTAGTATTPTTDATAPAAAPQTPDVQVTISGTLLPDGSMQWRTNPLSGKVVYEKPAAAPPPASRRSTSTSSRSRRLRTSGRSSNSPGPRRSARSSTGTSSWSKATTSASSMLGCCRVCRLEPFARGVTGRTRTTPASRSSPAIFSRSTSSRKTGRRSCLPCS